MLRRERDLYRRLLELDSEVGLAAFVEQSLGLLCEIAGAHEGYLEIHGDEGPGHEPRWWAANGLTTDQVDDVRANISHGIIAAALKSGKTIATHSALLDPRFSELASVRVGQIAAVLCAPIGGEEPRGALYLQRRVEPRPFSSEDQNLVEIVARHLAPSVERLLAGQAELDRSDPTRPFRGKLQLDDVVGRSDTLAAVLREVAMVAPLDVNVLLTGESGTGKSQIAWVIHENGPRARKPLVEINCASIPEPLIESELFGSFPGAHSTARTKIEGKVAAAEGGTLFLDEIGELPLSVQAKLLQLLQTRVYYPLGCARPLRADVRLIAATNSDLAAAVRERRFREDLFYRLRVVPVRMPRLDERREDIPELARHFAAVVAKRHRLQLVPFSRGAIRALMIAEWPGHVRQLENAVEAALIRAASVQAREIERSHLFPGEPGEEPESSEATTFHEATRRFQADLLGETLEATGGSVVGAARRLQLTRSHVYNLMRSFGLERKRP